MVMPLIGGVIRAGAKKLAEKGGKEGAKKVSKRGNRDVEEDILDANLIGLSAAKAGLAGSMLLDQEDRIEAAEAKKDQEARETKNEMRREARGMKKGGMASASKRADGCAIRGKTKGRIV